MNVLIIHAHNEPQSFTSALKDVALNFFLNRGDEVIIKDLYEMQWDPVASRNDFKSFANPDYFSYMKEEMNAFLTNSFSDEIKQEMDDLLWADLLVFNFPLWWSSTPAILKGWFDKILAFGFAYHPREKKYKTGAFIGKKALCCITTGGSESAYTAEGEHGDIMQILHHIHHGTLYFCGINCYKPFFAWRAHLEPKEVLEQYIEDYKEYLKNFEKTDLLY